MKYVEKTIISQYANSPIINQLIQDFDDCIKPDADLDKFYSDIWNISTAKGFGLDIWGKIVGVGRVLRMHSKESFFGFSQGGSSHVTPFDEGVFFTSGTEQMETFSMIDDAYRNLIMVKALANISRPTARTLNKILTILFSGKQRYETVIHGSHLGSIVLGQDSLGFHTSTKPIGIVGDRLGSLVLGAGRIGSEDQNTISTNRCYVVNHGYMHMGFVFEFSLTEEEKAILYQSGVFPIPNGVLVKSYEIPDRTFGFSEAVDYAYGFNEGIFSEGSSLNEVN